jgi:CHAT domain-containing protein/uncharacterized protein HemY
MLSRHYLSLICVFSLLVCPGTLGSLTCVAQTDDDAAIRKLIDRFFVEYQKKNLEGLMSLWSAKSVDLAASRRSFERTFNDHSSIKVKVLSVDKVTIEADNAKVLFSVEVNALDARTGKAAAGFGQLSRAMQLVREGSDWKIARYISGEEDFAADLIGAKNEEERQTLLNQNEGRVRGDLVRELNNQGRTLFSQSKFAQALAVYEIGLNIASRLDDKIGAALLLVGVGNVRYTQGNYQQASDAFQQSLKFAEEAGSKPDIGRALSSMGTLLYAQGNYSQSLDFYLRSMKLREELADKPGIGALLGNIAGIYYAQGSYDQALEYLQRGLKLAEELGDKDRISTALNNIGALYLIQGDYIRALEVRARTLKLREELAEKHNIAFALNGVGQVYYQQGDYQQALEFYRRALQISTEIGQKAISAACYSNIGAAYYSQGDYNRALEFMHDGLKLNEEVGDKPGVASSLNNLGALYNDQGNNTKALQSLQQSLKLAEELGYEQVISSALANIAHSYQALGQYQDALVYADRAVAFSRKSQNSGVLWQSITAAGDAYMALNQIETARHSFVEAISIIEKIRGQLAGGERGSERFFESKVAPYYAMVDLSIKQQDPRQALLYAERAKGRVLLDVLSNGKVNIAKAMTSEEAAKDRALIAELNGLNTQISRLKAASREADLAAATTRLEKVRLEYEAFQSSLYAAHPELKVQRGESSPLTPDEAATLLADNATALLEYVIGEKNSYLFVITRGSRGTQPVTLKVYPLNLKREELATASESFRQSVAEGNLTVKTSGQQLYDQLMKPAERQLAGVTRLVVVPDGPLWDLPFQALYRGRNGYLLEGYAISYAPSLSVLREMDRSVLKSRLSHRRSSADAASANAQPVLLALGNPRLNSDKPAGGVPLGDEPLDPLPNAEREVNTLGKLYGSKRSMVLTGEKATEEELKAEAGKYLLLHLATHAILDDRNPMYSRIMLSSPGKQAKEDGQLEAWELMNLDLKAEMVVLSACQTSRGRLGAGEGMIGMSWALFVAGSPTVIVSQWKVDSARTTDLMLEFHRNLLRRKPAVNKAEALRAAALKLLHSQYNHPAYWAGFVIIGSAK